MRYLILASNKINKKIYDLKNKKDCIYEGTDFKDTFSEYMKLLHEMKYYNLIYIVDFEINRKRKIIYSLNSSEEDQLPFVVICNWNYTKPITKYLEKFMFYIRKRNSDMEEKSYITANVAVRDFIDSIDPLSDLELSIKYKKKDRYCNKLIFNRKVANTTEVILSQNTNKHIPIRFVKIDSDNWISTEDILKLNPKVKLRKLLKGR